MKRLTSLVLAAGITSALLPIPQLNAEISKKTSQDKIEYDRGPPSKVGAYVDRVEYFKPGQNLTDYERKINNVLGKPKKKLSDALSLGHYGEVIVAYTGNKNPKSEVKCFMRNLNGPSIYVHEPSENINLNETVEVLVSTDKVLTENSKWISLGIKSVTGYKNNWISFQLPKNIEMAYHVKLRDTGSKLVNNTLYTGFEASSVYLTRPCREMV